MHMFKLYQLHNNLQNLKITKTNKEDSWLEMELIQEKLEILQFQREKDSVSTLDKTVDKLEKPSAWEKFIN